MRIKHVHIENFRSIKKLDIDFMPMMMFIGQNNHGKSNILTALSFFFNQHQITADDFYVKRELDDAPIIVEITFSGLDEQDKTTFKSYVQDDNTITVQCIAKRQDGKMMQPELHGIRQIPKVDWLKEENAKEYSKRDVMDDLIRKNPGLRDMIPATGRLTIDNVKDMQSEYIEKNKVSLEFERKYESGLFLGEKNVANNIFGDFILIPAVKHIGEELAATAKTSLGKLFNHAVKDMVLTGKDVAEAREKFENIMNDLQIFTIGGGEKPEQIIKLQDDIAKELDSWGCSVDIALHKPDFDTIFTGKPMITVDDGVPTDMELKGHGLQRFFMFILIKIWTNRLKEIEAANKGEDVKPRLKSNSLYFVIEEPELFLHPQAQRDMLRRLNELADVEHHQVLFCTHSSFFVDMNNYRSICIVSKKSVNEGTCVLQVKNDLFEGEGKKERKRKLNMAYWFNPDRSEMFFAKKVALVEGQSEKALFPFIAQRYGVYDENVCLVDCGGKGNILLYQEVLNAFNLPHIIIHDEDPVKAKEGEEEYTKQTNRNKLNKEIADKLNNKIGDIVIMSPTLDDVCGISKNVESKALSILDKFEKEETKIPDVISDTVKKIYT